jgi:hypothetical protein
VENGVSSLREALKGQDLEAIRSGMSSLAESLQKVSVAAYQAASAGGDGTDGAGPSGEGAPEGEAAEGAEEPAGEETVEGEYKEV